MKRIFLFIVAAIMLLPFLLMISGSLQSIVGFGGNVGAVMRILPPRADTTNYSYIFALPLFLVMIMNSAVLVVGYVVPAIIVNGLAAYAFAFYKFRRKKLIYAVAMTSVFIPAASFFIPRYVTMRALGLIGLPAVICIATFWAAGLFMFRNYFESIPVSLIESARMDGAGDWRIFSRIVLPMSKPIVGAAMVFQGVTALGDYLWQLLNFTQPWQQPMLIGLYLSIYQKYVHQRTEAVYSDFGYSLAVGVIIAIPMILIFLFSSRYFISGIATGSVKE